MMGTCPYCDGVGSEGTCGWCGGKGFVVDINNPPDYETECPRCDGSGIAPGPCNWCGGTGEM